MKKTFLKTLTAFFLLAVVLIPPLTQPTLLPPPPTEEGELPPQEPEEPGIEPQGGRGTEEET